MTTPMLFPTLEFAVFFVVVFVANWLLRPVSAIGWRIMILVASLYFYGYWDARFVALLLGSILFNHLLGERIGACLDDGEPTRASRWWVRIAVVGNLAVLGWFKYYGFFSLQVANWFEDVGIEVRPALLDVLLPVGISFFTFQALSYVIDIGRGHLRPMGLLDFAVYLSFFPQLVAGPIVRATEFLPQLLHRPDPRFVRSGEAFWLILAGLFKKVVISSYLADSIVDRVFAVPGDYNAVDVLIAVYAYAIQIYADFSGYTDIAIGVALLLGFRFPQNFDAPYRSLSVQDFWRRWHMTLSRWLRDYLYIPLGGNRGGRFMTYRNLMLTMVLGGLWHGAAWTFVVWGAIHGGALAVERAVRERWDRSDRQAYFSPAVRPVVQWIATFNVVCLAWVFFRSSSLTNAWTMLGRLTVWGEPTQLASLAIVAVITGAIAMQFVSISTVHRAQAVFARMSWAVQGAVFGVALVAIDVLGPEGVAPFIYFQF